MRTLHVKLLSLVLCAAGCGLTYLKVTYLGLPLVPDQESFVWTVEARIEFDSRGGPVVVDFDVPNELERYEIFDEFFASGDYGLTVGDRNADRRAEWSIRRARGVQRLYYQVELVPAAQISARAGSSAAAPRPPDKPAYPEPLGSTIKALLAEVRSESADIFTFTSQLLVRLNRPMSDTGIEIISKDIPIGSEAWVERIRYVLAGAQITSRMVRGIVLDDGKINETLTPWLEVHNGQNWEGFDPVSGLKAYPANFVLWTVGDEPVLRVEGGRNARAEFGVAKRPRSVIEIANQRAQKSYPLLSTWSLFKLPLNTQYVYRVLLMIPLGALVVILMRSVIGIPTFGTFMPILIAIAFRETELLWGIVLFCLIVGAGLSMRFYLERLRLLLVSRLTAILTLVVLIMLAISILSNELGFMHGFSIALFPVVILTMVIERMSITWDELGPLDAFKEGAGSLVVATLGYLVMSSPYLQHVMFTFPELLLVVLALAVATGTYTGYRLTELLRFRDLATEVDAHAGSGKEAS